MISTNGISVGVSQRFLLHYGLVHRQTITAGFLRHCPRGMCVRLSRERSNVMSENRPWDDPFRPLNTSGAFIVR